MLDQFGEIDTRELDLPDTIFIRDIESRVFQSITIKCLSGIKGISLLEGNLIDNLLGREGIERIKGIYVEQDSKNHAVNMKIELNIAYGLSIPEKAEEIQSKLVKDIVRLTGLHVASIHIVFKNLITEEAITLTEQEQAEEELFSQEDEYSAEL